jgi:hypothetical protein
LGQIPILFYSFINQRRGLAPVSSAIIALATTHIKTVIPALTRDVLLASFYIKTVIPAEAGKRSLMFIIHSN